MSATAWPLFDLRLHCRTVNLRPVTERDLPHLAAIQPDDYQHDPRAELLPALDVRQNRARPLCQGYWRSLGTWSPSSWCLDFAVEVEGAVVGVQSLEAERLTRAHWQASGQGREVAVRGLELCRPWFG